MSSSEVNLKDFWYIVAETKELKPGAILERKVLGESLALFLGKDGKPVALKNKCLHRAAPLSVGRIENGGQLRCSYHGWLYNESGEVIHVPSEGPESTGKTRKNRCTKTYATQTKDDFIYVRIAETPLQQTEPFTMPCYQKKGYTTIRLQNRFKNNVTNCAENFVDIPHTTYVHPKIFRNPSTERLTAKVERSNGNVKVTYHGERTNFGIFKLFLNPKGTEIRHTDEFYMPNITTVNYWFGGSRHFIITSQLTPINEHETLVYTDLTYNYGIWNWISRPIVRKQGQAIIDQDVEILNHQYRTILEQGTQFQNTPSDVIHTYIESIRSELEQGRDPRKLSPRETDIEFWI